MKYLVGILYLISLNSLLCHAQSSERCRSPNTKIGQCISIRECEPLLKLLRESAGKPESIQFLRDSTCGFQGRDPKVCCTEAEKTLDSRNYPLLPSDCGRDLTQRIVGGERADIDEFPWMALLEYRGRYGTTLSCGGALISKRYVLTAGHCLRNRDNRNLNVIGVRLGEYDIDSDQDCILDDESMVCADPAINVGIEEIIVHSKYSPNSKDQTDDIGLLRLSQDVTFTNFIKPVCLPQSRDLSSNFVAAGWGKTENRSESNIKLKINLPLSSYDHCRRVYGNANRRISDKQFCAGGEKGKDTCRGDSGGPLMTVEIDQSGVGRWTSSGIVSYGPSNCGTPGWPGVYTKVSEYTDWILENMRR